MAPMHSRVDRTAAAPRRLPMPRDRRSSGDTFATTEDPVAREPAPLFLGKAIGNAAVARLLEGRPHHLAAPPQGRAASNAPAAAFRWAHELQRARDGSVAVCDAKTAADLITKWFLDNGYGGATNYSVGTTPAGDIIISKVGGVTAATKAIKELGVYIQAQRLHFGRDISLAQTFNTAVGSNHAEMCIMAAAGQGGVNYINCTGPHCGFCAAVMKTGGVALGKAAGDGDQMGWTHPFAPLAYGQQLGDVKPQLTELASLPIVPAQDAIKHGQWLTKPSLGKSTAWL